MRTYSRVSVWRGWDLAHGSAPGSVCMFTCKDRGQSNGWERLILHQSLRVLAASQEWGRRCMFHRTWPFAYRAGGRAGRRLINRCITATSQPLVSKVMFTVCCLVTQIRRVYELTTSHRVTIKEDITITRLQFSCLFPADFIYATLFSPKLRSCIQRVKNSAHIFPFAPVESRHANSFVFIHKWWFWEISLRDFCLHPNKTEVDVIPTAVFKAVQKKKKEIFPFKLFKQCFPQTLSLLLCKIHTLIEIYFKTLAGRTKPFACFNTTSRGNKWAVSGLR